MTHTKTASASLPLAHTRDDALAIYARRVSTFFSTVTVSFIVLITAVLAVKLLTEPNAPTVLRPVLVILVGGLCGAVVLAAYRWRRENNVGSMGTRGITQAKKSEESTRLQNSPAERYPSAIVAAYMGATSTGSNSSVLGTKSRLEPTHHSVLVTPIVASDKKMRGVIVLEGNATSSEPTTQLPTELTKGLWPSTLEVEG